RVSMQRLIASRRTLVSLLVLFFAFAASFSFSATQIFPASAASTYTALSGSYMAPPPQAQVLGHHAGNAQLSISMLLQPSNQTQLDNLLIAINNPASNQYHQWLSPAQFNAQFAPSGTAIAQVQNFLQTAGLKVSASSTPFLVHATGTTPQVETAFHTSIIDY